MRSWLRSHPLTPSYAGVTYDRLDNGDRLQWPVKGLDHPGTPILHVGQFTRGKGLFAVTQHIPPVELPDKEYPMLLKHWPRPLSLAWWRNDPPAKGLMEVYGQAWLKSTRRMLRRSASTATGKSRVTSRRGLNRS